MRFRWVLAALIMAGVAGWAPAITWAGGGRLIKLELARPVQVRALTLVYDRATDTYIAEGQVEVVQGSTRLRAHRVRLNASTMVADAEGDVVVETPEQVLTGQRMVVDLERGVGKVYEGRLFMKTSGFYVRGAEIEKLGPDTYRVVEGGFTTCQGPVPAWEVTASRVDVTIEGYGRARNAAFRVRGVPVLWSPYLIFPVKFKRSSGLLVPELGMSDRDGFIISQPYFQVLGDDQDATITLTYMSRRGVDVGGEYRYYLAPGSKGMIMADYLPDDWCAGQLHDEGQLAHAYASRWWVRMKADQNLPAEFHLTADIDLVSDQDYLREFDFGHSGFKASNTRFTEWFGRGLEPAGSLVRKSTLNARRSWSAATFNATLRYYDNLTTDNEATKQYLPELSFAATRQPLGTTPLYYQFSSSYQHVYRRRGATGHLMDLQPSVSCPLNLHDYLELTPQLTWHQRLFTAERDTGEDAGLREDGTTYQWSFSLPLSTYLSRVYDLGGEKELFKLKHGVRPWITYTFRSSAHEDDVVSLARRGSSRLNQLSYGIRNTLTTKTLPPARPGQEPMPVYRDVLKLDISHSINIDELRRDPAPGEGEAQPLGNVTARIELRPWKNLTMEGDAAWNPNPNRWERLNALVSASDSRGDSLGLEWRYTYPDVKQLISKARVVLTSEWALVFSNRHDFLNSEDLQTVYQLEYTAQCWGLKLAYISDTRSDGVFLAVSLAGFGEVLGLGR